MEDQTPQKEVHSTFKGLYKNARISVKTLDKFIVGGILAMILILFYGIANNGYLATYDSKGGTDVPSQEFMYGDLLDEPEPPTREGYRFVGWYMDENYFYPFDFNATADGDVTLYARWEKVE
ncbi:MAG: InlB B-repeat-containing protein [Firmicutes bacterium]|nr:InlB B-repeat-containing protein [Bacillota bacterium]